MSYGIPTGTKALRRGAGWVLVCRERSTLEERAAGPIRCGEDVANLVGPRLLPQMNESLVGVYLDARHRVVALAELSRGGLHGCSITAADALRPGLVAGASAFVLVHNHPSGDPMPSTEDIALTRAVEAAGHLLNLPLVDHVIVAPAGDGSMVHRSLLELGLL